ncbi:hypothetical protein [Bacillus sp. OTU530]
MEIVIELDNYKTNDTLEEDLVGSLVDKAGVIAALTLNENVI